MDPVATAFIQEVDEALSQNVGDELFLDQPTRFRSKMSYQANRPITIGN